MGKKIAVISALGGQGCTLAAACMGLAAAELGREVVLVDLCGFGGTLADVLSVSGDAVMNLGDVLSGGCSAEDALLDCTNGLKLLPSPVFSDVRIDACAVEVRRLVENLGRGADVIADWRAGAVPDCGAVSCFDVFVICACADKLSLQYAAALRRKINSAAEKGCCGCEVFLLLTRFSPDYMHGGGVADIDECIDTVGAKLLGVVPFDEAADRAVKLGDQIDSGGEASRYCRDAVRRLFGEKIPLDCKPSLFNKLKDHTGSKEIKVLQADRNS